MSIVLFCQPQSRGGRAADLFEGKKQFSAEGAKTRLSHAARAKEERRAERQHRDRGGELKAA